MIALGGPKLKHALREGYAAATEVSMIALGGPKLKLKGFMRFSLRKLCFNDSTGWAETETLN